MCTLHRNTGALLLLLGLASGMTGVASAAEQDFSFANDMIRCTVSLPECPELPESVRTSVPLAMKTAIQEIGVPANGGHLYIRIEGRPSFRYRLQGLFQPEMAAMQEGDEIRLQMPDTRLKLSFRLAHECTHWLIARKYPTRPPLWLDEGLANAAGAAAATATARTQTQQLERPVPAHLSESAYSLDELTGLTGYPPGKDQIAAFYWQAEALVNGLRERLGKQIFSTYLELLCTPDAPDWQTPLREHWYFNDGDIEWLARRIRPDQP